METITVGQTSINRHQAIPLAWVEVDELSVFFETRSGSTVHAIDSVSLAADEGTFVALVGPTGCGKTTLLNVLAGFVQPTQGRVRIGGEVITGPLWRRGVVFQDHALFPWLTVAGNVAFGPSVRSLPARLRRDLVERYLALVGLSDVAGQYPSELSGGMKQRVGIARALANQPDILLMDEPFGALDALTRETMQAELLKIWLAEQKTIFLVTHSIEEAIFLADRVFVLSPRPGRILAEFKVPLLRPRERESEQFNEIARSIRKVLFNR